VRQHWDWGKGASRTAFEAVGRSAECATRLKIRGTAQKTIHLAAVRDQRKHRPVDSEKDRPPRLSSPDVCLGSRNARTVAALQRRACRRSIPPAPKGWRGSYTWRHRGPSNQCAETQSAGQHGQSPYRSGPKFRRNSKGYGPLAFGSNSTNESAISRRPNWQSTAAICAWGRVDSARTTRRLERWASPRPPAHTTAPRVRLPHAGQGKASQLRTLGGVPAETAKPSMYQVVARRK
jgi:hypothetical protein